MNHLPRLPSRLGVRQPELADVAATDNVLMEWPSGLHHAKGLRQIELKVGLSVNALACYFLSWNMM